MPEDNEEVEVVETKDDRITQRITSYLWLSKRGSEKKLLMAVRRKGIANANRHDIERVCKQMAEDGIIRKHSTATTSRKNIWILSVEKVNEFQDRAEAQRAERKAARDEIEAQRTSG